MDPSNILESSGPTLRERRTVTTYGEGTQPGTSSAAQDKKDQEKSANFGGIQLSQYKEDHPIWQDPAFAPNGYPRIETWNSTQQKETWERLSNAGYAPPPPHPEASAVPEPTLTPSISVSDKIWRGGAENKWKWAGEEDEVILTQWETSDIDAIAAQLGRSKAAVTARWHSSLKQKHALRNSEGEEP